MTTAATVKKSAPFEAKPLGQRLLASGCINSRQLDDALAAQSSVDPSEINHLVGRTLVSLGHLTSARLRSCLVKFFTDECREYRDNPSVPAILSMKGVEKRLDGRVVLDGIDLDIPEQRITAIIGISGGGKSVTLKHLVGLMRPDQGVISLNGKNLVTLSPSELQKVRRRFSLLFQGGALFDSLNVFDNVAFPLRETTSIPETEIHKRVMNSLEEVNLAGMEMKFPDELSGGMNKRAALARALITRPEIILLDEPTAGLDPIIENAIHHLICDTFMRTRTTMVIISHSVPSIFKWCHHVIVLHQGKVRASGPALAIQESLDPVIRQFIHGDVDGPIHVL
ncbi:MAG: ABC transporter ATP-binding protein [Magnetococcales bacterium]|nr:ABC transporter ATP-binding protein [Magnetococcales bacterium]